MAQTRGFGNSVASDTLAFDDRAGRIPELLESTQEEYERLYPTEEEDFLHCGTICPSCEKMLKGNNRCPDCDIDWYYTAMEEDGKRFFISAHCAELWVEYNLSIEKALLEEEEEKYRKEHQEECGCGGELIIVTEEIVF